MSRLSLKRTHAIELFIILLLIIPPVFFSLLSNQIGRLSFTVLAVSTIFRDLSYFCLILYLLWKADEPFESIGLNLRKAGDELILGGVLFFPFFFVTILLQKILYEYGLLVPHNTVPAFYEHKNFYQNVLAVLLIITVAITEETIFRGYIFQRVKEISSNEFFGFLFSALLFASGHSYEGIAGVIITCFMGLIFSFIYVWRGSLIAPVIIHFLHDYIGIFILANQ